MIFTTLIPIRRNDGSPVSQAELDGILESMIVRFGGLTVDGTVTGYWIDDQDGKRYQDQSLKVWSAIDPAKLPEAEKAVREIGRKLDQVAMYFEVNNNEVRFLRV